MNIRVAVVDDQALVRSGFAVMLGLQDDIEVVAEAGAGWRQSNSPAPIAQM